VKQANVIKNRSLLATSLAATMAMLFVAQCQGGSGTTSVVASMTSSAPGGFIYDGATNWVADAALGLCQISGGKLANCVLPPTSTPGIHAIVGQPAFDPLTGFAYLPDQSTASMGIWRYPFNGKTFGVGVNIAATLGVQRPAAIAFGTDGNLYVTMAANGNIARVTTPAAAAQTATVISQTVSALPAHGLAQVGTQLWVVDRDGILDIVDPVGCGTKCRGAIMTQILGLASPSSITWDTVHSYVYIGSPSGVVRLARITGVTDTYTSSTSTVLFSDIPAVGLDGAGNLLLVDDPTAGQVPGGATVYSTPFFIPGSNPPVQTPSDGQGATPQPPITLLPTIFPDPIANPAALYSTGLTTPVGAVFMGTHLWVVDGALGFCKVVPPSSLTACVAAGTGLPAGFVPGAPAYDPIGHFAYLPDTTTGAAGAGILRFTFNTVTETLGISPVTVATAAKLAAAVPAAVLAVAKGGATAPSALAFGPDKQLYVSMVAVPSIVRVTAPATATHLITTIGSMFESSPNIAFHNTDLFDTETTNSSTMFSATLCKGTCSFLFLGVIMDLPRAVAADANFVYIGATCPADAVTVCTGGIVWRYDPVADTITRLADFGLASGVSTPFSAIAGLALDNLGVVMVVDQTSVWKVDSTTVSTITSLTPNQAPESSSPTVTINGTGFLPSLVVNTCPAITPGNVTFVSPTQITATFAINPAGPLGACAITVTTATGISVAGNFNVLIGPPALTSMAPTSGFRGHPVFPVSITGANLGSGTLNAIPGIAFSVPAINAAGTLLTTNFTISATATLGARSVTVTTPSGTSNALTFTVATAPPVLTSIAPTSSVANKTVPVTLTGTDLLGATVINTGDPGITVTGLTVVSPTQVTASLTIASTVAAGTENISVTTPGGTSNTVPFTILPALTSISPVTAKAGTATPITLTGTSLLTATINAGANITVSNVVVVNVNSITATFTTAANSPLGAQSITVTDPVGGTSNAVTFTITAPTPSITIAPNTGVRGTTVPVILTGSGLVGATFATLPTGITVSGTPVVTFGQITANLVIATDAPLGAQSINVTTPGGTTTNVGNFTVTAPVPTLVSVNPAQGAAATTVAVTFTGTGLVGGTLNLPTGFTLSGTPVVAASGATITANLVIASTVATGPQSITVTTPGGTSNAVTFNILPGLTSIAPNTGRAGATPFTVTLTGTSLLGATSVNAGANITVTNLVVVNATTITATFTSAPAAPVGPVNVTVTSPAGTSNAVVFTLTGPIPVITTLSPATGGTGATVPITITGTGLTLGTLNLPPGVTIVGTPVVSFTQITATLLIAGNATLGAQTISVTTPGPGNTSNAVTFTVFALAPTLTSVAPTTGVASTTVTVTLAGTGLNGASTVINTNTAVSGISVSGFTIVSATQITATLVIGANASSTPISVTNTNGTSNSVTFGIVPTLSSIAPATGVAGTSVPVTLTGTSFTGATAINTGTAGITVTGLTVVSNTQITATFVITAAATQGNHSISVTTPGGTTAQAVTFNVLPPAPVITSLNNTTISKASSNVGMNVNGSNLGNLPVSSFQVLLNGVPQGSTIYTIQAGSFQPSQTQIRFNWTFLAAAPITDRLHVYTVTVTTPSGTSNAFPFTITN
jgi:IPT/TIG domain